MDQNVVFNPNFKLGLRGWHSNSCTAFVSPAKHHDPATKTTEGQFVCVVTSRKETWHGLEQELTPRLKVNVTYSVTATVMVSNASETLTDVEATLRLESPGVHTKYMSLGKVKASGADWSKLQGSFCLDDVPNKATFYLEGPPPAIDILVKYVDIRPCASSELRQQALDMKSDKCCVSQEGVEIVLRNPDFKQGLEYWYGKGCKVLLLHTSTVERNSVSKHIAVATNRTSGWQGIAQDVTGLLKGKKKYEVSAFVRIRGEKPSAEVLATLCIKNGTKKEQYITLGKVKASSADWSKLQGSFCLDDVPSKATFYLEGPPPAIDILVKYVDIRPCASSELRQQSLDMKSDKCGVSQEGVEIVLRNPDFKQGLEYWYGKGCKVLLLDTSTVERNSVSKHTAVATNRTSGWQGIEQDVTGLLKGKKKYEISALVRIRGERPSAEVLATLWIKNGAQKEQYITLGKAIASSTGWVQLKGSVLLNSTPEKAAAYIEGPPAGIDLLINSFSMFSIIKPPSIRPVVKDPNFGVNIVENSSFLCGLNGWSSLGSCSLGLDTGAPLVLPPAARGSLGFDLPVTGVYMAAKNRTHIWEGPSQNISGKIKLFVTYQVSAWVRIGHGGLGPQKVNVALGVDGQWVNGGEVEGDSSSWKEIAGSFRFDAEPENVLLYVQGPSANVDLMVANLMIFAVDRTARFEMLKTRTEKIRKRDAVIQVREKNGLPLSNCVVEIKQKKNTFPLGSCINSYSLEKDSYLDFFLKNFNWAVFENELKWSWTEKESNKLNYKEADELCNLCKQHGIPMRGHCIFWETEGAVQKWVKELDHNKLGAAVVNRLIELVSRFRGKFEHYDVNNEMLHGSFYKDRLGEEILPYMFKLAQEFDPAPKLFVNDYHVIDGYDAHSSPEKYIQQIWDLQAMGAPIGGIGVQGHIAYPVGAIISNALDKLAVVGLPIWFTEVDVESPNEFLRSDDLEVVLREAYAHPSVEGVVLWGFMETAMHRVNAHLVDADGTVNEAGKTLMTLKREWQTTSEGKTDETGCFCFRGYHGVYTVTVWTSNRGMIQKDFDLGKGDNMLVVDVNF